MQNIIFHSNILSSKDVPFINLLYQQLELKGFKLVLTGWNPLPEGSELTSKYHKLPTDIQSIKERTNIKKVKRELESFDMNIEFLLERFNWWFPEIKNTRERDERIVFLHFHLHHYLKLIKYYNPGIVLIWNGNDPRHVIFKTLAKKFGLKTYFFERGPLPSVLFYDFKGVLSHSSVKELSGNYIIEHPNNNDYFENYKDWYIKSNETLWEQPKSSKTKIRERFNVPINKKITLFVGQVDNDIQTKLFSPFFKSNLEAFKFFLEYCRDDNHFVVGKHHPKNKLPIEAFRSEVSGQNNVVWTDEFPLDECLKQVDNVVAVNSSVIFDALLYEKPVLTLGTTMLDNKNILYQYGPGSPEQILTNFYSATYIDVKLSNYKKLLWYMFECNLLFTKDENFAVHFSELIKKEFIVTHNSGSIDSHVKILNRYSASLISPRTNSLSILRKVYRKLKKIYRSFFSIR